jgi:hypothetical protein
MKLNVKACALACGLIWGFGLLFITWWIILFEGQADVAAKGYTPPFVGLIYRGYSFTIAGSFIGLAWALVDGFIGGAIFAWIYNFFCGKKAEA